MFTGLIEDVGSIRALHRGSDSFRLQVDTTVPPGELVLGESIAVNGVCLTVAARCEQGFAAEVSPETARRSTLDRFHPGRKVNLERALRFGSRLGGHLVSGHVDAVGRLSARTRDRNAWRFVFRYPPGIGRYLVEKGSVAVDGISLTVSRLTDEDFEVAVIGHTLDNTILGRLESGDEVNLEVDLIGKYVERLLACREQGGKASGLDLETLAKHGFL